MSRDEQISRLKECERGYSGAGYCRATTVTYIENEYLKVVEFSSSNKKLGNDIYTAQWNITYRPKKDFQHLPG